MATLLPSLSSDEEDNSTPHPPLDDGSSGDEIDEGFEFGGILGEDGGMLSSVAWSGTGLKDGWSYQSALKLLEKNDGASQSRAPPRMDVANLIEAKRRNLKNKENDNSDSSDDESESEAEGSDSSDGDSSEDDGVDDEQVATNDMEADVLKTRAGNDNEGDDSDSNSEISQEDHEEVAKAAAFFDTQSEADDEIILFAQLSLSRPLLRGVASMGFVRPTPIQAAVMPVALAGRDVCASAVTGSGKTAAFVLPILERITHRVSGGIKGLILTPTRELAAQCLGMMSTFSQFTNIRSTLVVGGAKNVNAQAAELRSQPDIVVATPGRLLDHVTNSPGVTLDDVEFLILDEADRLLDLGFQDEVHELVNACPSERQTMLFSATMTTKVDDLVKLSLKHPVRIKISDKQNKLTGSDVEVAPRLEQEFVRVRPGNEGVNREGMLLALLTRTFRTRAIVFFDTKAAAHRLMIICGLCGIRCAELHGNLTQTQRLTALEQFREGEVDVLLATDLAARGLDIDSLKTVINFEMPSQVSTYVHRCGRTARAGRGGKSCTLIGEGRRHLMKEVIKDAEEKSKRMEARGSTGLSGVIRSRTIPPVVVAHFVAKIVTLEPHVKEVLAAEAVARMDRIAEMEATKAHNIIEHSEEIQSRPQREWFASNKQKASTKAAAAERQKLIEEKAGTGKHRMTRKKRRAREAREELLRFQEETQEARKAAGKQPKKMINDQTIKTSARAHKKQLAQRERELADMSIREENSTKRSRKATAEKKKRKGAFASDALGDSSLFSDEKVAFTKEASTRDAEPVGKSEYQFIGFDPTKPKKTTRFKSVNSFKSRKKYKRR